MKPNGVTPYSVAVIGKQALNAIEKEGTFLSAKPGEPWKVKSRLWQGRKIYLKRPGKWLTGIFKRKKNFPGKQLYQSYVTHARSLNATTKAKDDDDKDQEGLRIRMASAFKLAGVCEIQKGKKTLQLRSTDRPIDKRIIKQLDHLASCSPVRLAYEFIAHHKKLPKGYLVKVLQPALAEPLISAGIPCKEAMLIIRDQCEKCHVLHEKHVDLESMMELKNRIRYIASEVSPDNVSSKTEVQTESHTAAIKLAAPVTKAGYECDSDDLWLIQHKVDNSRVMRIAGDFAKRVMRWAQRNKRRSLFIAAGCSLEVLLSGLATGGIGPAITAITSIGFTMGLFFVNKVVVDIRSSRIRKNLKKYALKQSEQPFDQYLDNCNYLISEKNITKIMNAYENLCSSVNQLKPMHRKANHSAKEHIRYQKQKAYAKLRKQQLESVFGVDSADATEYHGSYDQMMVKIVEKISQLDRQFNHEFDELWTHFDKMPESKRWQIFDQAANQRGIKAQSFGSSKNYYKWIQSIFSQDGDGLSAKLRAAFKNLPKDSQITYKIKRPFMPNHYLRKIKKASVATIKTLLNFSLQLRKPVGRRLIDPRQWVNVRKLVLKDFLPRSWGPFMTVWIFYYFGDKISLWINKSINKAAVKKLHTQLQSPEHKFNSHEHTLSSSQWRSLRREMKDKLYEFVNTLKSLEKEHKEIKALLDKKSNDLQEMSEEQRDQLFATLLLKRKMLEEKLNGMLAGAIGHMHEEIVRGTWQQQEQLKALDII